MTPVSPVLLKDRRFEERVWAKDQPQYQPLPTIVDQKYVVTSRWSLGWRDRLRLLFGGSVYVQQMTFGHALQPIVLTTEEPTFECYVTVAEKDGRISHVPS